MPAMIRLAAIAGNRNRMISQSIAISSFRKGRDEQIDVEVEELDVVLGAGDTATDGAMVSTAAPACGTVSGSSSRTWLDDDDLHLLPLHLRDEFDDVRRATGTGLGFHIADHVQAEPVREVRPRPVIRDHLRALVGRHRGHSSGARPRPGACRSRRSAGRRRPVQPDPVRQAIANGAGDRAAVAWIEPVVRVAGWMNVAHRAGDLTRPESRGSSHRRTDRGSRRRPLDLRIAAVVDERRQPADFQFPAHDNQQIGAAELQDEARLHLDGADPGSPSQSPRRSRIAPTSRASDARSSVVATTLRGRRNGRQQPRRHHRNGRRNKSHSNEQGFVLHCTPFNNSTICT